MKQPQGFSSSIPQTNVGTHLSLVKTHCQPVKASNICSFTVAEGKQAFG